MSRILDDCFGVYSEFAEAGRSRTLLSHKCARIAQMENESRLGRHVIRVLREKANFSIRGLAISIDKDPAHIWRVERGYVTPSIELISQLADALETSRYDMLKLFKKIGDEGLTVEEREFIREKIDNGELKLFN
jgi:ribosome-binding protein aMBF1 (putative translation factor)